MSARGEKLKTDNIPATTIARLPLYLRCLQAIKTKDIGLISSQQLAQLSGRNAAQLRKDLSYLGELGTRGVGYDVDHLIAQIAKRLGITTTRSVAIFGAGKLGQALLNYSGFAEKGFQMVAVFDSDPRKVGQNIGPFVVADVAETVALVRRLGIEIAIIATPATAAQQIAGLVTAAGVKAILNFAPTTLKVTGGVCVRQVDLATELQIIGYHVQRTEEGLPADCYSLE